MEKQASNIRTLWDSYRVLFVAVFLGVLVYLAFEGVLNNEFILFDDAGYITQNSVVLQGLEWESIQWAFTTFLSGNWHPLTWLSHMTDVELFGIDPAGHHFMSLAFHTASVMILFAILYQTTRRLWPAAFASVLFGIHPLRVESVAWAAERKDVLSCFFGFLAIWAYVYYTRRKTGWRYALIVVLLLLGLMCKAMLVTWPFVFLLLDFWPLRRYHSMDKETTVSMKNLWAEKIPFVLLSIVFSGIAFAAQRNAGAVVNLENCSFALRLENSVISYVHYLYKIIWPAELALLYPFSKDISPFLFAFCLILFCCVTVTAVIWRQKRPYFTFGWLWYLGTLVPVIGLVQIGNQSMADRYTYIPSIGISIMAAWLIGELSLPGMRLRRISIGIYILVCGVLVPLTWRQVMYWQNSISLFEHTIGVTGDNYKMRINYALALKDAGDFTKALRQCEEIVKRWPGNDAARELQEEILMHTGRIDEAIEHWLKYLQTNPDSPENTLCNLGVAFARKHDYPTARDYLEQAIQANPKHVDAYVNLGVVLKKQGHVADAVECWEKALALDNNEIMALRHLGWTLAVTSDPAITNPQKALVYAQRAAEITRGRSAQALDALAAAYASCGHYEKAVDVAQEAITIAKNKGLDELAADIEKTKQCYENKQPWVEESQPKGQL